MNIFKRLLNYFFPEKKKQLSAFDKIEQAKLSATAPTAPTEPAKPIIPSPPVEVEQQPAPIPSFDIKPVEQKIEKPVVKAEKLIFNTLNEAKSALSQEWNKRKKKNIYDNHRIARDYKKINSLYEIINRFKAAQA